MEFGITFKGDMTPERTLNLIQQAEAAGFDYVWFFDSHVLWQDCYAYMGAASQLTKRVRFGPFVTNPAVRDWSVTASMHASLARLTGGRIDMGVGRGDSSQRMLGRKPVTYKEMGEFVEVVRKLVKGEEAPVLGYPTTLTWSHYDMPIWIAAYGPLALKTAGIHADGLIIQLGDPFLSQWFIGQFHAAAKETGRDVSKLRVCAAAPVYISEDMALCRAQTRWFPAMVGNHVADLVEKYHSGSNIPADFLAYIEGRKGYDYREHADKDADHLDFITDSVIDRFGILGPLDKHVEKIGELKAVGVTQFNIYLMCGDEENIVEQYGKHVIPAFR
ncbi:MAG: TIGR03842 family LLM class F420-dependent oxidoreductase [Anaerolineae bacterium]|nr:TIGR03842 family LLM class F420-dependent oxidoreductase [Anaerolineae bacterium]